MATCRYGYWDPYRVKWFAAMGADICGSAARCVVAYVLAVATIWVLRGSTIGQLRNIVVFRDSAYFWLSFLC